MVYHPTAIGKNFLLDYWNHREILEVVDASQIDLIHVPGLVLRRKDIGLDTVEVIMIAV